MFRRSIPVAALATLAFAIGALGNTAAFAQGFPPQGPPPGPPPPYAAGDPDPTFLGQSHVRGFVRAFDRFNLTLGVHHQGVPVQLHQGTIINPRGLTLQPGMLVRIDGYFQGGVFYADRIVLAR